MSVFGGGATTTPADAPEQTCATISKVLQIGSRGEEVVRLQKMLGVETSGYFGPLTHKKLIAWQLSKGVISSAKTSGAGTTGPKTRSAMKCAPASDAAKSSVQQDPALKPSVEKTVSSSSTTPGSVMQSTAPAGSSGGTGSSYLSPYGYTCTPPGLQPIAATCTTGSWQLSADEAGCALWLCLDSDDRG